jgi:hypothetical protein
MNSENMNKVLMTKYEQINYLYAVHSFQCYTQIHTSYSNVEDTSTNQTKNYGINIMLKLLPL